VAFHGVEYTITVEASEQEMTLTVEEKQDLNMWKNTFGAGYLEEISRKTGKHRSYISFLEMLSTTLTRGKDTSNTFIDLLAFKEL